jgi:hypothetical protein
MTERTSASVASFLCVAALVLATAVLYARTSGVDADVERDSVLYVRSGAVASRLSLSFDAIVSDLYWMRAIQHAGRERQAGRDESRFARLEPLLSLTVALDPQFNAAYRFGAILLAEEPPNGPGRADQAIGLLARGLRASPLRWQYAQDIGFVHYFHTGRFDEAGRWFTRAAAMPGAPRWLGPVAAITLARGGDRQGARVLLVELAATSNGYIKRAAERGLAQLQALDDLDHLRMLLSGHAARTGAYPTELSDLDGAPLADPSGHPYAYDRTRGIAGLAADSPLSPLPRTLGGQ